MSRLNGKIALVTGGASGLGEAICRAYACEGAQVFVADLAPSGGGAVAASIGGAAFLELDVTLETEWERAVRSVTNAAGRIDILVNNAGITTVGSVESLSLADFRRMLDIDLVGVFLGCKYAIPLMKAGGSIINMASMCSLRAQADLAGYNAAKAGVAHLTKSAALHYAAMRYGIRCNSIHPGVIETPILKKVMAQVDDGEALYQGWVATHPIGRLGMPQEVAALAVYLGSDESTFATGGEFVVDGGSSL